MRRLSALVRRLAALIPESRLEFIARANQGCIDALAEPPCASIGRCPVIKMRPSGR